MKRRIAISAGHSNVPGQDMGAIGMGLTEGIETVKLRDLIVKEFKERNESVSVDPDSNVTWKTVALFKQYFSADDIVLDIHFNASLNAEANGVECLIPAGYDNFEHSLAQDLCLAVSNTLGIKNRGVKTELDSARKKLLWMTIPSKNVLLEVCFLTNKVDTVKYLKYTPILAEAIALVLLDYKYK